MPEPIVLTDIEMPSGWYFYGRTTDPNLQSAKPDVKASNISVGWDEIETLPGIYNWTSLDSEIDACKKNNIPFGLQVFLGSSAPAWLYGTAYAVPLVKTKPTGDNAEFQKSTYPYYFNAVYKDRYASFLLAVTNHLTEKNYDKILVYWGVCEGTTGDPSPYKGDPLDKKYAISKEDWSAFRHEVWDYYNKKISKGTRLIFNPGNDYYELNFIQENYPDAGIKEGNAGHGTNYVGSLVTYNIKGIKPFSRTETDGSMMERFPDTYTQQINFAMPLQALALGVDIFCTSIKDVNRDAMKYYNKYIEGLGGICFMHDCIDFADVKRFPVMPFGEVIAPEDLKKYQQQVAANGTNANGLYNTAQLTNKMLNPERRAAIKAFMGRQGAIDLPDSYNQNDFSVAAYSEPYCKGLELFNPHYQKSYWRIGDRNGNFGQWCKTFQNATFGAVNPYTKISVTYFDEGGKLQVGSKIVYGTRTSQWVTRDFYTPSTAGNTFRIDSTLKVCMVETN